MAGPGNRPILWGTGPNNEIQRAAAARRWRPQPCTASEALGHAAALAANRVVVLINRCSTTLYSGMVPSLIAGLVKRHELEIDLRQLCERAGVAFMAAEIQSLDPDQHLLHLKGRPSLQYSWLSLDVGAISRASASGIPIKPLEPALAFLNQQSPNDPEPFRVIGAGAARVEVVLALRRRWPKRPLQLQVRPGQLSDILQRVLEEARVTLIQNQVPWLGPCLLCTGSCGPAWLAQSGLPVNEQGRVQTDACLKVKGRPHIFASGDCGVISDTPRAASESGRYAQQHHLPSI